MCIIERFRWKRCTVPMMSQWTSYHSVISDIYLSPFNDYFIVLPCNVHVVREYNIYIRARAYIKCDISVDAVDTHLRESKEGWTFCIGSCQLYDKNYSFAAGFVSRLVAPWKRSASKGFEYERVKTDVFFYF